MPGTTLSGWLWGHSEGQSPWTQVDRLPLGHLSALALLYDRIIWKALKTPIPRWYQLNQNVWSGGQVTVLLKDAHVMPTCSNICAPLPTPGIWVKGVQVTRV